ncbi:MAG: STAS domain-containing protein [Planctomycetota bacterium]
MEIVEERQGAVTVVRPKGQIGEAEATILRQRLRDVLERSLGRFVLDAADIPYADSTGLELLLDVTDELSGSGRVLKLCAATDTLREALKLTGIGDRFEHFADVQTGVRSFL